MKIAVQDEIIQLQKRKYEVATPLYTGPLDLLLQLIERADLDITSFSLSLVTEQFLAHLKAIQNREPDEVSGFLVIASKLLQIKSASLLPRPPETKVEEDPGEMLAAQLVAYKRYKEIALLLGERESLGLRSYLRLTLLKKTEEKVDLEGVTIEDLRVAANGVLSRYFKRQPRINYTQRPRVNLREKISEIVSLVKKMGKVSFFSWLKEVQSRIGVVVSFMAVLELIKRDRVLALQSEMFRDIQIEPGENWEEDDSFELEFGE